MNDAEGRQRLLERIANAIRDMEPSAKIYLYGSRARGDYDDDSDWDFLIILDGNVDTARQEAVWNRLYDLRLELDEVASAFIASADQWANPPYSGIPLFEEVRREGIAV